MKRAAYIVWSSPFVKIGEHVVDLLNGATNFQNIGGRWKLKFIGFKSPGCKAYPAEIFVHRITESIGVFSDKASKSLELFFPSMNRDSYSGTKMVPLLLDELKYVH